MPESEGSFPNLGSEQMVRVHADSGQYFYSEEYTKRLRPLRDETKCHCINANVPSVVRNLKT